MEYGITADGFSMRRLDEIYNDSCKRFEDEIGVNPSENPQSLMESSGPLRLSTNI